MTVKRGLGKGLDALLGGQTTAAAANSGERTLALSRLVIGKFQPRRRFAAEEMAALADSIRQHGILQPLVVRPHRNDSYEIVAGERRFRAAKLAGLKTTPVVIHDISDDDARMFALIENLQRADLNAMEQANGIARLIDALKLTHAEAGVKVGLSRPAVSNLLRLRELSAAAQKLMEESGLEMGHARALLALPASQQEAVGKRIIRDRLTTRETEHLVKQMLGGSTKTQKGKKAPPDADTRRLADELTRQLALRVDIQHNKSGNGKMILHYGSAASLEKIIRRLRKNS